ncbi:DUF4837 family protein [Ichthyenterobacterium sp. W332]|uniref:DUF4837 family protein n=1 Tax=Microcosmobacter mediterraneus TaxID=3075607 RepID=A0ABU2YIN7_9FLAO|nr:DUF4837 family protein [Ichthyenterobacterium sp. W332]MDT0558039.1 DUF4837 family protein [Ichthyenterobacterium sp. W332]
MRILIALCLTAVLVLSCGNEKGQRILPESSGKLNQLSVVIDNNLWEGTVGETVREIFGAPVEGLPQEEPLFSMNQMPSEVFNGFAATNRIVLKISVADSSSMSILTDTYAKPQTVVSVVGESGNEIIKTLKSNANKFVDTFKKAELSEQQKRIAISLGKTDVIKKELGVTLKYQTAYRIAKQDDKFFWLRKTLSEGKGSLDMMIYEVPIDAIRKGDSAVTDIVKIRDEYGKKYITGEDDNAYMGTEDAYAPYIFDAIIDNKPAYETKGIWDMKNDWMSGPFINYAVEDKINKRYVIIEGYAYAPSARKREYMLEIEAILKTLRIQ